MHILKFFLIFEFGLCSFRLGKISLRYNLTFILTSLKSLKGRIHTLHLYDPASLYKRPSVAYLSWNSLEKQAEKHNSRKEEISSKSKLNRPELAPFKAAILKSSDESDEEIDELVNPQPMKQWRVPTEPKKHSLSELEELLDNVNSYMKYIFEDRPLNAL